MKYVYEYNEFRLEIVGNTQEEILNSEEYAMLYPIQGQIGLKVEEKEFMLKDKDLYLNNCNTKMRLDVEQNSICSIIYIPRKTVSKYINGEYIDFTCNSAIAEKEGYDRLRVIVKDILDSAINLPRGRISVGMTILFFRMLELLIEEFVSDKIVCGNELGIDERKEKIIAYIEENFHKAISLSEVAEYIFVTYHYLSRNFKNLFGTNFHDYLNKVRLRHAERDLLYTNKSITDIALDNGYNSASVFNRIFKETYKMPPTAFRRPMEKNEREQYENTMLSRYAINKEEMKIQKSKGKRVEIAADVSVYKDYTKSFNRLINGGYASDVLAAHLQQHLLYLKNKLNFEYVRIWNIFCEEMSIRKEHDTEYLNFGKIDSLLDFFVENGIKPFIEFGDKPQNIVNKVNKQSIIDQTDMGKPIFRKVSEFKELLNAFMHHIVERYGIQETSKWGYEFWDDYYRPERKKGGEHIDFLEAFDIAYLIIKKWVPQASVGGGGMGLQYVSDTFLEEWSRHQQPDFITFMYFPHGNPDEREDMIEYQAAINFYAEQLDEIKNRIKKIGLKSKIYVTEFASSVSSRNFQNDSCYQAAYCIFNAVNTVGKTDLVGYWLASDILTTDYDTIAPIYGGSGLLTKDGICKPVFYAFEFLNLLDDYLVNQSPDGILCTNGCGDYSFVLHNFQNMDHQYYIQNGVQWDIERHVPEGNPNADKIVKIRMKNMVAVKYRCFIMRMGRNHGGMLEQWSKLAFARKLRQEEVEYMKRVCVPELEISYLECCGDEYTLELNVEVQEIIFVKIVKHNEEMI